MDQSTTIISENIDLIRKVYDNRFNWCHDHKSRDKAIDMLNEFDMMTYRDYWLSEQEECLLDELSNFIEVYY